MWPSAKKCLLYSSISSLGCASARKLRPRLRLGGKIFPDIQITIFPAHPPFVNSTTSKLSAFQCCVFRHRKCLKDFLYCQFTFVRRGKLIALLPNVTPLVSRFSAETSKKRQRCAVVNLENNFSICKQQKLSQNKWLNGFYH
jgi:hypothetical protein